MSATMTDSQVQAPQDQHRHQTAARLRVIADRLDTLVANPTEQNLATLERIVSTINPQRDDQEHTAQQELTPREQYQRVNDYYQRLEELKGLKLSEKKAHKKLRGVNLWRRIGTPLQGLGGAYLTLTMASAFGFGPALITGFAAYALYKTFKNSRDKRRDQLQTKLNDSRVESGEVTNEIIENHADIDPILEDREFQQRHPELVESVRRSSDQIDLAAGKDTAGVKGVVAPEVKDPRGLAEKTWDFLRGEDPNIPKNVIKVTGRKNTSVFNNSQTSMHQPDRVL